MQRGVVFAPIVSACRAPPRRHGPALYSSRAYHGVVSSTSPSSPSGSRKNMLCAEPKSLIVPSLAPSFISRVRMVSKASGDAACSPKWSMRPLPDVGVENPGVERFQALGILGYPGNVVDSVEQHSSSPSQLTVLSVCTLQAMIEPPYWWRVTGHPSARPTR